MSNLLQEVVDYIHDNYRPEDGKRLSGNPLVSHIAMKGVKPGQNWRAMIDKIAYFNGIDKVKK